MIYLLDVNVLIALGYVGHQHHRRVRQWIDHLRSLDPTLLLATCSITELGFVRVASGPAKLAQNPFRATEDLLRLIANERFVFIDDDLPGYALPDWVRTSSHTTDGHLLWLAELNSARLLTLDAGIPGTDLVPELESPWIVRDQPLVPLPRTGTGRVTAWLRTSA